MPQKNRISPLKLSTKTRKRANFHHKECIFLSTINVTRSSLPPFEEYCQEIKELWESRWLTNMGVKHGALEEALKAYLGVENITLYTNGHLALENILEAYDFPKGSEVITTPFTFASTTHAIWRCGLTPVFCDVKPDDFTLDPKKIEALITPKTVALVPVHVYGSLCDTDAIEEIAKRHNLKVIYDAAHAFGVSKNGLSAAGFGDASMFSFHATKVFNTIEGGCVTYKDETLKDQLDCRKNFGQQSEDCIYAAGNAKMSEFQAAMGLCNLRHLKEEIAKRRAAVEQYRRRLGGVKGIYLIPNQEGVESNYAYFPAVFESYKLTRDQVFLKLREKDIIARKYFAPLTSEFSCYKDLPKGDTPLAKAVAERVLCLPLYADLTPAEVDRICDAILE